MCSAQSPFTGRSTHAPHNDSVSIVFKIQYKYNRGSVCMVYNDHVVKILMTTKRRILTGTKKQVGYSEMLILQWISNNLILSCSPASMDHPEFQERIVLLCVYYCFLTLPTTPWTVALQNNIKQMGKHIEPNTLFSIFYYFQHFKVQYASKHRHTHTMNPKQGIIHAPTLINH